MNHYITGSAIRALREQQHLTQAQLAEKLSVSDKTISKWETGRGLPDISLLEPLAQALKVSVAELLTGEQIINTNRAANMLKSQLYVCPICGNVFQSMGPLHGFLLRHHPAAAGTGNARRRPRRHNRAHRRRILYFHRSPHDKRPLHFLHRLLHRQPL